MSELSSKSRNKLPSSKFGLPKEKKYPMPDRAHAGNAKARASQQEKAGNLSSDKAARIRAMADRILSREKK